MTSTNRQWYPAFKKRVPGVQPTIQQKDTNNSTGVTKQSTPFPCILFLFFLRFFLVKIKGRLRNFVYICMRRVSHLKLKSVTLSLRPKWVIGRARFTSSHNWYTYLFSLLLFPEVFHLKDLPFGRSLSRALGAASSVLAGALRRWINFLYVNEVEHYK